MLLNVSKEFLNEVLKNHKSELLGKLMKRYEVIYAQDGLSSEQRKSLLRKLIIEETHESFRDLESKILCNAKGIQFSIEIIKPSLNG
jgi:hypothetical protein